MIRKYLARPLFLFCLAAPLAHAANADLTTFSFAGPNMGNVSTTANYAFIPGRSSIENNVTGVTSFDWNFTDRLAFGNSIAFLIAPQLNEPRITLASSDTLSGASSTGWQTYAFRAPYTGYLAFYSLNSQNESDSFLEIRNMVNTAPVPEPETYAMLLAGLGLMASIAHRRSRRTANSSARDTPAIFTMN